jgi:hypothetical protein
LMLVTHTTAPVIIALLMVEVVVATRMVLEPTGSNNGADCSIAGKEVLCAQYNASTRGRPL